MPLVFKLGPGERASRDQIVEIVSDCLGCRRDWTREKVMPQIDAAVGGKILVADADGVLRTPNDASSWTLWLEPPDEDSAES